MYIPIKYLWSGSGSGSGSSNITDYIVDSETINPEYNNVYDYYEYEYVKNISWNSFATSSNKRSQC